MKTAIMLVLLVAVFWAGCFVGRYYDPRPQDLPTIAEVQQILGVTPDGILGPQTQKAWDLYICDQASRIWINEDTMRY